MRVPVRGVLAGQSPGAAETHALSDHECNPTQFFIYALESLPDE